MDDLFYYYIGCVFLLLRGYIVTQLARNVLGVSTGMLVSIGLVWDASLMNHMLAVFQDIPLSAPVTPVLINQAAVVLREYGTPILTFVLQLLFLNISVLDYIDIIAKTLSFMSRRSQSRERTAAAGLHGQQMQYIIGMLEGIRNRSNGQDLPPVTVQIDTDHLQAALNSPLAETPVLVSPLLRTSARDSPIISALDSRDYFLHYETAYDNMPPDPFD